MIRQIAFIASMMLVLMALVACGGVRNPAQRTDGTRHTPDRWTGRAGASAGAPSEYPEE